MFSKTSRCDHPYIAQVLLGNGEVSLDFNAIAAQATAEHIVLDPRYHDILAVVKGARNGAVYGTKVRFPHALVCVHASPSPLPRPVYRVCC